MSRSLFCVGLFVTVASLVPFLGVDATWNAGANGTAAMGASLFGKLFTAMKPELESLGTMITLGPFNGTHWSVGTFKLSTLKIESLSVTFDEPNQLHVDIGGLTVGVPQTNFSVFAHIFGQKQRKISTGDFEVSCDGTFSGTTAGASGSLDVAISTSAQGNLTASVETPNLVVGTPNVTFQLDGACRVAGLLIDYFKKEFLEIALHEVNKLVPAKIQHIVQKNIDEYLPLLPLKFVDQPIIAQNHLEVTVQLLAPHAQTSGAPVALVQPHIFTDRDLSVGISTQSFDDLVAAGAADNLFNFGYTFSGLYNTSVFFLLIPKAYWKCPSCPFGLHFNIPTNQPPTAIFGANSLQLSVTNAVMNFTALSNTTGEEENLFSVLTNLSFGINNLTVSADGTITYLKFDLALQDFSMDLGHSFLGHIDVHGFSTFVQDVLKDLVVPLFNAGFQGLPLNLVYDGFGLVDWRVDLHQDAISLGANVLLPPPGSN